MASESAATFTSCTNCEVEFATTALYICTKLNCTKFGEPYCEGCGESSHKRKNHSFNIDEEYIKKVDLNTVQQNINLGISTVNRTLEIHHAKAKTKRDINIQAASASFVTTSAMISSNALMTSPAITSIVTLHAFGWCAGLGTVAMAAQQVITHSYRYYKGEITKKELCYNIARGLAASAGTGLGSWGGMLGGATLGTLIGGPIGTVIGGIIGGIVGGLIGANIGRKAFEKLFPDDWMQNNQGERERVIRDSLKLFGFSSVEDIVNREVFNERELKKTYRTLAKRYHPDKNGGTPESYAKFHEINTALGILLGLLEKPNKTKVVDTLSEIRAITWKRNIKQLNVMLKQEKLLYIVDICCKWNKNLTMEFLSTMRGEDILETINDLNDDNEYDCRIKAIDKTRFVHTIEKWIAYSDGVKSDVPETEAKDNEDVDDVPETEVEDNDDDDHDDIEYDEMLELRDKLRKGKVLFIADICKEYDEDCILEELLSFRKNDILELVDEINKDDSNEYNIPVMKKNKFAKIISEFVSKQPELCLAK